MSYRLTSVPFYVERDPFATPFAALAVEPDPFPPPPTGLLAHIIEAQIAATRMLAEIYRIHAEILWLAVPIPEPPLKTTAEIFNEYL